MSEQNKRLVRRAVEEVWNNGDYDNLAEFVSEDFVVHAATPEREIHGRDGVRYFYTALRSAFPNLHFTIDAQIAEGDCVVTRWTARGMHAGSFQGVPATGKHVTFSGLDLDRIVDGRVVECWANVDELGLMQQLGAIPAPA
jgi:steroid delta-isomerase-like uncharacterized protein